MCGRVILTLSAKLIEQILKGTLDINKLDIDDFEPRYNVGPGQNVLSVIQHKGENRAGYMNWMFIPTYAKDETSGYKFVNARSETIHQKNSFKDAFQLRRCLVLCNGFYEWHREEKKTPFFFYRQEQPMYLGGIWNKYMDKKGHHQYGLSLITTAANNTMASVHHRQPVIIKTDHLSQWLDPMTPLSELQKIMQPVEDDFFEKYQVSDFVNNIRHDGAECIQRVE
jgi:putative SOS response-associated peptidase YedK